MTRTVGARELRTRLGFYLRLVRSGRRLVVTVHGRPVAEIRPLHDEGADPISRLQVRGARRAR